MKLILILLFISPAALWSKESITLSSFEGGYVNKISEEILKEAYLNLGYELAFVHLPPERALRESSEGRTDGEVNRTISVLQKYPSLVQIPVSLVEIEFKLLAKKNSKYEVSNWESLNKYCIASQIGVKLVDQKLKAPQWISKATLEEAIKVVANGRCDLVVAEYYDLVGSAKKMNLQNVEVLKTVVDHTPLYHYLHKKNQKLVPLITKELQKMKASGRLDQITVKVKEQLPHL